jgi:hypothetical protein
MERLVQKIDRWRYFGGRLKVGFPWLPGGGANCGRTGKKWCTLRLAEKTKDDGDNPCGHQGPIGDPAQEGYTDDGTDDEADQDLRFYL